MHKRLWDSIHLDRIELACDPSRSADLAAIIMQVSGSFRVRCREAVSQRITMAVAYYLPLLECSRSVMFSCGPDPRTVSYHWITDPDPALFFSEFHHTKREKISFLLIK